MKLYISNEALNIHKVVNDPKFIPRVGDRVDIGYSPAATVTIVLFVYNKNQEVYIQVE